MLNYTFLICLLCATIKINAISGQKKYTLQLDDENKESWKGKWFPFAPNQKSKLKKPHKQQLNEVKQLTPTDVCDDGVHFIDVDYNPADKRHSFNFLCLANNRTLYMPNLQVQPILKEHLIPPAYTPQFTCLNETIQYEDPLPTYGKFRLKSAKFGTYRYLPPQRWLRNLAEGAIVFLYHPCAFYGQVNLMENLVKSCLYGHIISPTQQLTPDRPLALLAWGRSLEMSVVDERIVVDFIKKYAKRGPISYKKNLMKSKQSYEVDLLQEARLITDLNDSEICGYKE